MKLRTRLYLLFLIATLPLAAQAPLDTIESEPYDSLRAHNLPDTAHYADSLSLIIPAYEMYNYSWNPSRLNPYRVPVDSMPDSLRFDCSDFVYPTKSTHITSPFGFRRGRYHYGTDVGIQMGDTIRATFSGRVRIVAYERRGYGHYIVIRHNNGFETISAHLSRVLVSVDQDVNAGDIIGLGGSTGRSTGPHLHYEVRYLGNAFNPEKLIDFSTATPHLEEDKTYLLTKKHSYSHNAELKSLAAAAYHRVRPGETLSHIARRYGTSVKRLCQLNRIRETSILQIGQKIRYR